MNPLLKIILLSLFSPLLVFAVHIVMSRTLKKMPPQLVTILAVVFAQFPLLFLLWRCVLNVYLFPESELVPSVLYSMIMFGSAGYFYFHLFNTSETARRIRILHEIRSSGSLSEEDITSLYKEENIIELRLKRLVDLKQLKFDGTSYKLDSRILYGSAMIVWLWRSILGLNRTSG